MHSQSLKVKSFEYVQNDLSARTTPRIDINDNACALLKVRLALSGAKFKGDVVGNVDYKDSEYWVYLSSGSKRINISLSGFLPLDIVFADHGVLYTEKLKTYILTIDVPTAIVQNTTLKNVKFVVEPKNATIKIDNLNFDTKSGKLELPLSVGKHAYKASAPYYVTKESSLIVTESMNDEPIVITLPKAVGVINVKSNPMGADVIIGGKVVGQTPLSNYQIEAGQYNMELHKKGFQSESVIIDVDADSPANIDRELPSQIECTIKTIPSADRIIINNDVYDRVMPLTIQKPSGAYSFRATKKGYHDLNKKLFIDGTTNEVVYKFKKKHFCSSGGYVEGGAQFGSLTAVGASLGAYINNVNIEGTYLVGMNESEEVFWNTSEGIPLYPTSFSYKPTFMGGRIGFGLLFSNGIRFTPQIGFGVTQLKGTKDNEGETCGIENTYVASASIGARFNIALVSYLGISVVPEYAFAIKKGEAYENLSTASSKIKGWGEGVNCKVGLNIFF